jgi:DNA polymerase III delta prime subunit
MMAERLENIIKIENKFIIDKFKKNKKNDKNIEKITYTKEGIKEIAELSGGDMRYGINILQLVSDRFKNINTHNRTKKRTFKKKDYNSGDGMLTSVWGPAQWHFLHTMSFNYPVNPTREDNHNYRNYVLSLKNVFHSVNRNQDSHL